MSKLKNLIIFYPSYERGGATNIMINLVNHFVKEKIRVFLITSNIKKNFFKKKKNLKIISFNNYNISLINNRIVSSFLASYHLIKLFFLLYNKKTKVLSMQSNLICAVLSFLFNYKIAVRVSEDPCGATKFPDNKIFAYIILLTKFLTYNISTKIITNATKSASCVKKFLINKNKVDVLFNPYISKIVKSKKKSKKIFLNVGRICKQKNQKCLIKAFKKFNLTYKDYKLIICGEGYDKLKILNLIKAYNLKNKIIVTGWKTNVYKYYNEASCFILPSLYEGMPNALIDAVNYEIPIISSDASGVSDLLINGKGGIMIKNINEEKLFKKMIFFVKNKKEIYKKTLLAKKKINRFIINEASKKYLNFFQNLK